MATPPAHRGAQIPDIPLHPATASLKPHGVDRRDPVRREALCQRVLSEFTEMPGLMLTLPQACRLFGIRSDACARILWQHVIQGRLRLTSNSHYTLASNMTGDTKSA
jgi:hypothetical protein